MALTKDSILKAPISLWLTVIISVSTASILWSQTTDQVERNKVDIEKGRVEHQTSRENDVKHEAYFQAIMDSLERLEAKQ